MAADIDQLLSRYENGQISRLELIDALGGGALVEPAVTEGPAAAGAATQLNHVTIFVKDVPQSVEFYQRMFGMPVLTHQGRGVNLRAGSSFLGIYPADEKPTDIHHVCFGLRSFDADAVLERLSDAGVKGRVLLRGDTKELYFKDADNVRVQLQDVRYRGGVGPLGDRDPQR